MSCEPLNFEPVTNDERSVLGDDGHIEIIELFENVINSSPFPDIDEKAKRFVADLIAFVPIANETRGFGPKCVARATCDVLIGAARCIPCRHHAHDVLVKTVRLLETESLWKDHTGFGLQIREEWNMTPVFQIDDEPDELVCTFEEWLNVNSFIARLGKIGFGLWEMRVGLEGDDGLTDDEYNPALDTEDVANTRILVAAEWILQAGMILLQESFRNALSEERRGSAPWSGGPLFAGPRGLNLERWGFWKRRFGEVTEMREASPITLERIGEAIKYMAVLEAEIAEAWAVNAGTAAKGARSGFAVLPEPNFDWVRDDERSELNSDTHLDILDIFDEVLRSSPEPDIDRKAQLFVTNLIAYVAKMIEGLDTEGVAYGTWTVVISASSCVPSSHYGQDVLVRIVGLLDAAGKPWKDWYYGWMFREAWNGSPVCDDYEPDELDPPYDLDEWLNLNSFMARLGEHSLGMWELRCGLEGEWEGELPPSDAVINTRILVAAEWIIQDGPKLLEECLRNALSEKPRPNRGRPWRGGPLFPSTGFSLERWGFWKRQFGELGELESKTQQRVDAAVKYMNELEADVAATFAATK